MENNKFLNYARDDVFIISVNASADRIEQIESQLYLDPNNLFKYFASINALYSKTHKYIKNKRKIDDRLINIRKGLYNQDFLTDMKNNKADRKTTHYFLTLVDDLTKIYREMTEDYTLGIFPKIEIEDTRAGVLKQR